MRRAITIIAIVLSIACLTACEPTPSVREEDTPSLPLLSGVTEDNTKSLHIRVEDLSVDHYECKFTYLGNKVTDELAVGETDGWVSIRETPNDWRFYLQQGLWGFEAKAVYDEEASISFPYFEGYVNEHENALSTYIDLILDSYDQNGNGSVIFDSLTLPALYADRTNFYVDYELLDDKSAVVSTGRVPMALVELGDGVATMESFRVDDIHAGEYSISILVYEMNQSTGLYEVKSGIIADGIKVYSGCNSTVTGTFGDDGDYLRATIRTFQTSTTFTGKVTGDKITNSGNTTDDFTFNCTADSPTNIRWFVDGIEQTEITTVERVRDTTTRWYWTCARCKNEVYVDSNNEPSGSTGCPNCGTLASIIYKESRYNKGTNKHHETVYLNTYHDVSVTRPAEGNEDTLTVTLSQMGHGYSGATTHYVECIYTDVEGHTSSSSQELFVGSRYFPSLNASSIFIMGNGNEIDHWVLNISPDSSLSANGFHTYSSVSGDVTVGTDTGIWLSEGLWVVNSAVAYDNEGTALVQTTIPQKTYVNKLNPYINIENLTRSETVETGTIRIKDLKMNTLVWDCNYASGSIIPTNVDTDVTIYKLTDEGKDDSSFSPIDVHIDGCTLLETGNTVTGTSNGTRYTYRMDSYQIIGTDTQRDFTVPEGTYRVQIKINSGARDGARESHSGNHSYYAGYTEGDLEVIVNVSAHTTQMVTGTLSCNHCVKTDTRT